MKELFKIEDTIFYKEEFQDDINDYLDIIDIISEFSSQLKLEKIECAQLNDCCMKSKFNNYAEIIGVITQDDSFLTLEEVRENKNDYEGTNLEAFGIQIYKCLHCGKWMINILEQE
ncbi:MAG: hypothetical protein ACRC57_11345 [Sarcina sp.]